MEHGQGGPGHPDLRTPAPARRRSCPGCFPWREENFLKYASENYGIDKNCNYTVTIETNTRLIRNPARDQANAAVRDADKALAGAERDLAGLLADPAITPAAKNARIPALQNKNHQRPHRSGRRRSSPQAHPREAFLRLGSPRRQGRAAARRAPRPADGPWLLAHNA